MWSLERSRAPFSYGIDKNATRVHIFFSFEKSECDTYRIHNLIYINILLEYYYFLNWFAVVSNCDYWPSLRGLFIYFTHLTHVLSAKLYNSMCLWWPWNIMLSCEYFIFRCERFWEAMEQIYNSDALRRVFYLFIFLRDEQNIKWIKICVLEKKLLWNLWS